MAVTSTETGKKNSLGKRLWKQRSIQLFVLTGVIYIFVFHYLPMFGIIIGFKEYKVTSGIKGMFTSPWVGMKYFKEFFTDYKFPELFRNTMILSISKLVISFPIPIIFAIMLNEVRNKKAKKFIQTVSYLPYFISWVIVYGLLQILCSESGTLNSLLIQAGAIDTPLTFLTSNRFFYGPLRCCGCRWCYKDAENSLYYFTRNSRDCDRCADFGPGESSGWWSFRIEF